MSPAEDALEAAMHRLLSGTPVVTDGALTKNNLFREAGVSRATMNRSTHIVSTWERAVADLLQEDASAKKPVTEEARLRRELRQTREQIRALRERLDGTISLIALLSEDNRYLRELQQSSAEAELIDLQEFRASRETGPDAE